MKLPPDFFDPEFSVEDYLKKLLIERIKKMQKAKRASLKRWMKAVVTHPREPKGRVQ